MPELVALAIPGGPGFVEALLRVWDDGDAVLPVDTRLPGPALESLLGAMRPARLVDDSGDVHRLARSQPVEPGDALVMPTSGTTGTPKGVIHTLGSIAASSEASNAALAVDPGRDRWLCCLPISHIGGFSVITRALHNGTPLEVHPRFDAETVTMSADVHGATLVSLVPTALRRIDPGRFRRIVVGGSGLLAHLPPNAVASYGLTETASAISYDGKALDGVEIRVSDGEILVRAPMLARAYRDGTSLVDADGWFATGDGGELDDEDRLVVHGRLGDLINTGGEKVWPGHVEHVLRSHPDVADVVVVGRSDPEWGEVVVAVVVPADASSPPTLAALRDHVKQVLPAHAAPRVLELVDQLARTSSGKVRRSAIHTSQHGDPPGQIASI